MGRGTSRTIDTPSLAYEQAMGGGDRVRPTATPAGAFERAREYLREGRRIDMVALAADLGIGRATLYRWTGDRERLMADAVWAEAEMIAEHIAAKSRRKTGGARIRSVAVDILDAFAASPGVNAFLQQEGASGLALFTHVNGRFRPRAVAWFAAVIQGEVDAGRYRAPADPALLADGIVTIGERFLHNGGDPDVTPDPVSAGRMFDVLLREASAARSEPPRRSR
jgi:AcrR family transcriptional regulator